MLHEDLNKLLSMTKMSVEFDFAFECEHQSHENHLSHLVKISF